MYNKYALLITCVRSVGNHCPQAAIHNEEEDRSEHFGGSHVAFTPGDGGILHAGSDRKDDARG